MRRAPALIPLLCALLPAPGLAGGGAKEAPVVLTEARRDLDGDGRADRLAVRMREGRRYEDTEPWCGRGEKHEGELALRVELARGPRSTVPLGEGFFRAGAWSVVFADYNGDGRPDFNLGRYGGCNGWRYELFTVEPSGRVRRITPVRGGLPVSDRANSTDRIRLVERGFEHCHYARASGHRIARYRWSRAEERFLPDGERRVESCRAFR